MMLRTAQWVFFFFAMNLSAGVAHAENPLTDGRQLRSFLQDVWFFERYTIKISLLDDNKRVTQIRYFNLRVASPEAGEFSFKNKEMVALTDAWNIRVGSPDNGPSSWRIPSQIMECCYKAVSEQNAVYITLGGRIAMNRAGFAGGSNS